MVLDPILRLSRKQTLEKSILRRATATQFHHHSVLALIKTGKFRLLYDVWHQTAAVNPHVELQPKRLPRLWDLYSAMAKARKLSAGISQKAYFAKINLLCWDLNWKGICEDTILLNEGRLPESRSWARRQSYIKAKLDGAPVIGPLSKEVS